MPFIFNRERGKLTKTETSFPVKISEVRQGDQLLAYAQEVSGVMLQKVLLSAADAVRIKDDPDWVGPR